jgi:Zn-dependent peptidase ImmA (M78 family)
MRPPHDEERGSGSTARRGDPSPEGRAAWELSAHHHDIEPECEPLPDDWDETASELADSFIAERSITSAERAILAHFCHLCLRFAHMEVRIQGELLCEIPAHLSVLTEDPARDLAEAVSRLAVTERKNLELDDGPIEDLTGLLDDRGIKIIEWDGVAHPAAAFLFHPRTGPALLSLALPGSVAGRFHIAHAYGHLIFDVDPYENRFCPRCASPGNGQHDHPGGRLADEAGVARALDDIELAELRADLFARAFLLPAAHFVKTLRAFDIRPTRALDLARVGDVAFYYGVEPAVVLTRFADLALLPLDHVRALIAQPPARHDGATSTSVPMPDAPAPDGPGSPPASPPGVPARCANLGLALYLRREISLDQMATLLGTDLAGARGFLAASEIRLLAPEDASRPPGAES